MSKACMMTPPSPKAFLKPPTPENPSSPLRHRILPVLSKRCTKPIKTPSLAGCSYYSLAKRDQIIHTNSCIYQGIVLPGMLPDSRTNLFENYEIGQETNSVNLSWTPTKVQIQRSSI